MGRFVFVLIYSMFLYICEISQLCGHLVDGLLTCGCVSAIFTLELRKKARQLENEIDLKLVSFSKLGTNYSHHNGFKERYLLDWRAVHRSKSLKTWLVDCTFLQLRYIPSTQ